MKEESRAKDLLGSHRARRQNWKASVSPRKSNEEDSILGLTNDEREKLKKKALQVMQLHSNPLSPFQFTDNLFSSDFSNFPEMTLERSTFEIKPKSPSQLNRHGNKDKDKNGKIGGIMGLPRRKLNIEIDFQHWNKSLTKKQAQLIDNLRNIFAKKRISPERVFHYCDQDRSGTISLPEFRRGLKLLANIEMSRSDAMTIFRGIDSNCDNLLQFEEIRTALWKPTTSLMAQRKMERMNPKIQKQIKNVTKSAPSLRTLQKISPRRGENNQKHILLASNSVQKTLDILDHRLERIERLRNRKTDAVGHRTMHESSRRLLREFGKSAQLAKYPNATPTARVRGLLKLKKC